MHSIRRARVKIVGRRELPLGKSLEGFIDELQQLHLSPAQQWSQ
jgi:hypothetical protein